MKYCAVVEGVKIGVFSKEVADKLTCGNKKGYYIACDSINQALKVLQNPPPKVTTTNRGRFIARTEPYPNTYLTTFEQTALVDETQYSVAMFTSKDLTPIHEKIEVYTDGAFFTFGNFYVSSGAAIILVDSKIQSILLLRDIRKIAKRSRQVTAELGVVYYIQSLFKTFEFDLYYDYLDVEALLQDTQFCKRKKAHSEISSTYVHEMEKLGHSNITFHKVRSHTGNKYNEMADIYAKCAANISYFKCCRNIQY